MLFNDISFSNVIFLYRGFLTSKVGNDLLRVIELSLHSIEKRLGIRKKVFYVAIEMIQNMQNYFEDPIEENIDKSCSTVVIYNKNDLYQVVTINYVEKSQVECLKSRIDAINKMDEVQLWEAYVNTLSERTLSNKFTGSVGILSIVRRTHNNLEYNFTEVKDGCSFILQATISK